MNIDCYIPIKHGIECKKVEHIGQGYLHQEFDDSPYDVYVMSYCGRCHTVLGKTVNNIASMVHNAELTGRGLDAEQ